MVFILLSYYRNEYKQMETKLQRKLGIWKDFHSNVKTHSCTKSDLKAIRVMTFLVHTAIKTDLKLGFKKFCIALPRDF